LMAFGILVTLASILNLLILRSRMERLLQDALSEIGGT
jgi:hypothetical protein